jgi:hypothetical protein
MLWLRHSRSLDRRLCFVLEFSKELLAADKNRW